MEKSRPGLLVLLGSAHLHIYVGYGKRSISNETVLFDAAFYFMCGEQISNIRRVGSQPSAVSGLLLSIFKRRISIIADINLFQFGGDYMSDVKTEIKNLVNKSTLKRNIIRAVCIFTIIAYKVSLLVEYGIKYADDDQSLMWYGTAMFAHGKIPEP